jgi:hypothetical protein
MRKALQGLRRGLRRARASVRLQFDWKLLGAGVACLVAAIFPGPVELPGVTTLPALTSAPQRVLAGVVGGLLLLFSLLMGSPSEEADDSRQPDGQEPKVIDVRGRMLLRVRRFWIGEPRQGVPRPDRLEIRLYRRLDLVDRPLGLEWRDPSPAGQDRPLPAGASVHALFEQLDQALLILGPPGGGKTTMLRELLGALLDDAASREHGPVPMIFGLSSWKPGTPIAQWLADELHKQYGLPSRLARAWVDGDQIVPLLDGLDEVAPGARARCVEAINAFRDEHGLVGMAVCCRTDNYRVLGTRLRLTGAVVLGELDSGQVATYLRSAGPSLAGVRAVLRDDPILAELLRSPLMLNLVASAYRDRSARQLRSSGGLRQRRDEILGSYVEAMFSHQSPNPRWTAPRLLAWLRWLANAMLQQGQSIFRLEWMQPELLSRRWRRLLVLFAPAIVGILLVLLLLVLPPLGVLGPPPPSLDASRLDYWGSAVLFLVPVLLVSLDRSIRPWDRLAWSRGSLRRRFGRSFAWGIAHGVGV